MNDPLPEFLEKSRETRKFCFDFLGRYLQGAAGGISHGSPLLALLICNRIQRMQRAIEELVSAGLPSEAAVVALAQFELRLDVMYIGDDDDKANRWMNNTNREKSPWPVRQKIERVFSDEARREHERVLYREWSAIKHNNATAREWAFPIRMRDGVVIVYSEDPYDSHTDALAAFVLLFGVLHLLESWRAALSALGAMAQLSDDSYGEFSRRTTDVQVMIRQLPDMYNEPGEYERWNTWLIPRG